MRINSISTPAFGSIQIQKSKMNWKQRGASERLCQTIKYTDKYSELIENNNDVDIYILPKKNDIEIRLMDPYSGNFIRNKKGNILSNKLNVGINEGYERVTDRILNLYEKVVNGIIDRPETNFDDFLDGNTDIAKLRPKKNKEDIKFIKNEIKELMEDLNLTREEAEEAAFESHVSEYKNYNRDGQF